MRPLFISISKFVSDARTARGKRLHGFIAIALLLFSAAPHAAELTVFAAASLRDVLEVHARAFTAQSGEKVRLVYAGSNALVKQIEVGAPADVFISADAAWMDYAVERKLVQAASRVNLASNALVVIAPLNGVAALDVRQPSAWQAALNPKAASQGRLALADPANVPAGKYAQQALQKLGVWSALQSQLAPSENVRAALAFVARGAAPLGIVYRTDALVEPKVRVVATFAADLHAPIAYPAALVNRVGAHGAAGAFLSSLTSAAGRERWAKFGFAPVAPLAPVPTGG